jgi:hypothetical protein
MPSQKVEFVHEKYNLPVGKRSQTYLGTVYKRLLKAGIIFVLIMVSFLAPGF